MHRQYFSCKPYIIQQLYHKHDVIPQTFINYSLVITCHFDAYLQTIIKDHGFKKLQIISGPGGSILQTPELSRRKMITVIQQVIWPYQL